MSDIPEKIGKYKVVSIIAKGGMGTVYKAIHPTLRRFIIIKKLTIRGNPELRERFRREAQILLDLRHPNIVHMFDYFVEESSHYIALEYVDGMSLDKLIKKCEKLQNQTAMLIFRDACKALLYAHENGIVHRDIKPGNILISAHGDIKLADFGIASTEKEGGENLTQDGSTLGTPSYMPPEQFSETKKVDKRADIYAMGIMLYEMVTGKKTFPGKFSPETIIQIQKGKYIAPDKLESKVDATIKKLIKKMIRPNPAKRYKDIQQVLKITDKYLLRYDTGEIRKELEKNLSTQKYEQPEFKSRKSILPVLAAACVLLILSAFSLFAWKEGYVHRFILSPWYKPVNLTLVLPTNAGSAPDLPMRAFFFIDDNDTIPEVSGSMRSFTAGKDTGIMKAKPIYLRSGSYRIKVAAGAYVWWKAFQVENEPVQMELDFLQNAVRNLTIRGFAYDAQSGENLSGLVNFAVQTNRGWIDISSLSPGDIKSGSIIKARASLSGYETEMYSLKVEWYQDELFITSAMRKK
jgi:serine/threonine-protein kinase